MILAGVLSGVALAFHPDEFVPGALLDPAWRPVHYALLVGFLASVPGEAFALPVIAAADASPRAMMDMLAPGTPLAPLVALFGVTVPLWITGWVLVGVVTARAGVLPPLAGALLVVASVLVAVPVHFLGGVGPVVHLVTAAALGGAWSWLGVPTLRAGGRPREDGTLG